MANDWIFITRIPSNAKPRSTSIPTIRSASAIGPRDSRLRSAIVDAVSRSKTFLMYHLTRGVPSPQRAGRDILALHQQGVGGQYGAITHRYAVMDKGSNSDRTACAKHGS